MSNLTLENMVTFRTNLNFLIMKNRILHFTVLLVLFYMPYSSRAQSESIEGFFDHLVVSLKTSSYDSLSSHLSQKFQQSANFMPDRTKGFILPKISQPYVELWNSGEMPNVGNQLALGSKSENAIEKAKSHYGFDGEDYGPDVPLFTVGSENSAGHPYGGNFFVDYGSMKIENPAPSPRIVQFTEARWIIPETRAQSNRKDFRFYELEVSEEDTKLICRDKNGFVLQTREVNPSADNILGGVVGVVSLHFKLSEPLFDERTEVSFGTDSEVIYDKTTMIIVCSKEAFDRW